MLTCHNHPKPRVYLRVLSCVEHSMGFDKYIITNIIIISCRLFSLPPKSSMLWLFIPPSTTLCNLWSFKCLHSFHTAGSTFLVFLRSEVCCEAPQVLTTLEMQSTSVSHLIQQSLILFLRCLESTRRFHNRYHFKFRSGQLKEQAGASPWVRY